MSIEKLTALQVAQRQEEQHLVFVRRTVELSERIASFMIQKLDEQLVAAALAPSTGQTHGFVHRNVDPADVLGTDARSPYADEALRLAERIVADEYGPRGYSVTFEHSKHQSYVRLGWTHLNPNS